MKNSVNNYNLNSLKDYFIIEKAVDIYLPVLNNVILLDRALIVALGELSFSISSS